MEADAPLDLETVWRELDALAVVNEVKIDHVVDRSRGTSHKRVICTVWCCANHTGDDRQPSVKCNKSTCPDIEHAMRDLRVKILEKHAGCLQAAETARLAAEAPATRGLMDPFKALMAKAGAERAERLALAAEKKAVALRAEAVAAWAALDVQSGKRQRVDLEFWKPWLVQQQGESAYGATQISSWTVNEWRAYEDDEQERRAVEIEPLEKEPLAPRGGAEGYLHHPRRGLLGVLRSWARGSRTHVVRMVLALIGSEHGFGIEDDVRKALAGGSLRAAETDAKIVDRVVAALAALQQDGTKAARRQYHIILGACAPERVKERAHGFGRRVWARLRVPRGRRAATQEQAANGEPGRPFASLQAQLKREVMDAVVAVAAQPWKVGDAAVANGQPCTLTEIRGQGCKVEFRMGGVYEEITYLQMDGKAGGKSNARLRRPAPTLEPEPRAIRSDAITLITMGLVRAYVEERCARSPHQRDGVCRRVATHLKEEAQALILTETRDELFEGFQAKHQTVKLSRAKFYEILPWELKEAYRETCLCSHCENLMLYMQSLKVVAKEVLGPLALCDECEEQELPPPPPSNETDGALVDGDNDDEPTSTDPATAREPPDPKLKALLDVISCPLKSQLMSALVCGGNVGAAKKECVEGDCRDCGMKRWWSGPKGYRREVVEYVPGPNQGKLKPGLPAAWHHQLRWERLAKGAGKEKPAEGSKEAQQASAKEPLRETVHGSVVALLDEFENRISKKAVMHRRVRLDTAMAAKALRQNAWLGMLLSDYDWAENGVLELARQIQSEYWSLVAYSLFISITSYLIPSSWKDRTSELAKGMEVTVLDMSVY